MSKYTGFILGICIFLTLFSGCGRPSHIDSPSGQEFTLYQGQTAQITEGTTLSLIIEFISVTGDSRCPSDVTCIQAGSVTCRLNITEKSKGDTPAAVTLIQPPSAMTFDAYQLSYEVLPYPVSTKSLQQSDYYIKMTVTRLAGT